MKHLKIYEATDINYRNVILKVKDMVTNDNPKPKILQYISQFVSDDAKVLTDYKKVLSKMDRMLRDYNNAKSYEYTSIPKVKNPDPKNYKHYSNTYVYYYKSIIRKDNYTLESYYDIFKNETEKLKTIFTHTSKDYSKLLVIINKLSKFIEFIIESSDARVQIEKDIEKIDYFDKMRFRKVEMMYGDLADDHGIAMGFNCEKDYYVSTYKFIDKLISNIFTDL